MLEIDKIAYTFTGQGSQRVGMWDALRASKAAREIFKMTDEIVGFSLSKLCSEGPLEELTETRNSQPAIVAHSLAALAVLYELHPQLQETPPAYYLGHSVGEFSALAAAGVITVREAIYLIRQRGLLMEQLGGAGRMAALVGFADQQQVLEICQETKAEPANFNGPSQIVISGGIQEINDAIRAAKERKIKAVPLEVSRPFHSSLMRPVQDRFRVAIVPIEFRNPSIPIVLNTTARPSTSGAEIKESVVEQISSSVRWAESVSWVTTQGVTTFLEFGPRPILTGLLKNIDPEAKGVCVKDYESVQRLSL